MRYFSFCLIALFLFACKTTKKTSQATTEANTGQIIEFNILQLNDVYEISPLDNGRVGGMARVATIKKELEKVNPNLITVLAGDYLNPSLFGSLKCQFGEERDRINGRQMVDVMNALGVDYVTFGNHEFDLKNKDLVARDNESKFKIICANALQELPSGEKKPYQQFGKDIPDYLVHTFDGEDRKQLRLGLFGVVLPFNNRDSVAYLDHFETGKKAYEAAKEESDIVFGLTHLTMGMDEELAGMLPEIPLILGGHEHVNMTSQVGNTSIMKADANAKTAYIHWCKFNTATQKVEIYSQLFPITDVIPADPEVEKVVKKWEVFAEECMVAQGYRPNDTISFNLNPLDGRESSIRFGQTNLGKLIALAFEEASGADASFFNSGSIRLDDQINGFVKERDILGTLPFGGGLKVGPIKGGDLKRILDTGLADEIKGNGAYLQLGSIEPSNGSYLIKGEALEMEKVYQIALPGFIAGGGEDLLSFIADFGPYQDITLPEGVNQNDIRDIVIWSMRRSDKMKLVQELLDAER